MTKKKRKFKITFEYSHPKYRQALQKKFPSLVCAAETDDTTSTASGVTNVTTDEKPATA